MSEVNIGFIGVGNMGFAIINGIMNMKDNTHKISVFAYDKDESKIDKIKKLGAYSCISEQDILEKCKYVLLAVKPQMFEVVLNTIRPAVTKDTVIISIAAGITAEYIKKMTIPEAKVVLVMPNTPLLLGEGATALAKGDKVSEDEFALVKSVFDACGETAVISQDKMKEIIAINGSSPAFIYLFAKGFIDYADSVGIDKEEAKKLFAKSLIGSAKMMTESGYSLDELIKMVSSPGGTTLAGLDELYSGKLTDVVDKACKSCTRRAYELSK